MNGGPFFGGVIASRLVECDRRRGVTIGVVAGSIVELFAIVSLAVLAWLESSRYPIDTMEPTGGVVLPIAILFLPYCVMLGGLGGITGRAFDRLQSYPR